MNILSKILPIGFMLQQPLEIPLEDEQFIFLDETRLANIKNRDEGHCYKSKCLNIKLNHKYIEDSDNEKIQIIKNIQVQYEGKKYKHEIPILVDVDSNIQVRYFEPDKYFIIRIIFGSTREECKGHYIQRDYLEFVFDKNLLLEDKVYYKCLFRTLDIVKRDVELVRSNWNQE